MNDNLQSDLVDKIDLAINEIEQEVLTFKHGEFCLVSSVALVALSLSTLAAIASSVSFSLIHGPDDYAILVGRVAYSIVFVAVMGVATGCRLKRIKEKY